MPVLRGYMRAQYPLLMAPLPLAPVNLLWQGGVLACFFYSLCCMHLLPVAAHESATVSNWKSE